MWKVLVCEKKTSYTH